MSLSGLQHSWTAKWGYKKLPVTKEKPLFIICRLSNQAEQNIQAGKNSVQQDSNLPTQTSTGGYSSQQKPAPLAPSDENKSPADNSNQKTISKQEFTVGELESSLPRFGPSYGKDTEAIKAAKEEVWNNVLTKTRGEEQSTIPGTYLSAIKKIENQAREGYAEDIIDRNLMSSAFQWMMIKDGCFFLHLALCILGGPEQLGYSENHPHFGTRDQEEKIKRWIKAMYFIGNQIPYVVIRELMDQKFFRAVISKGIEEQTWRLPSDLPKMVLYLLVVEPELVKNRPNSLWHFPKLKCKKKTPYFRETPTDLLHGLHCLVLGIGSDPLDWEAFDVEAGYKDREGKFPSATEVEQVGVTLKKAKQGIREIKFEKKFYLFPRLYVPPFTFDAHTEILLQYLKSYEHQQNIRRSKREVTAYLRFMSDLIQTEKDVNILKRIGIIQVEDHENKDDLPSMLNKLGSSDNALTQNLRLTRQQIISYSTTTRNLLSLAAIAVFFTVVQTVFTILAYYLPRN